MNVDTKIAWETDASQYINKLTLSLASDTLPDAFTISSTANYLFYKQLLDNGNLADLTDAYAKCAGNYMKQTYGSFQEKNLEPFKDSDKLMGIGDGA